MKSALIFRLKQSHKSFSVKSFFRRDDPVTSSFAVGESGTQLQHQFDIKSTAATTECKGPVTGQATVCSCSKVQEGDPKRSPRQQWSVGSGIPKVTARALENQQPIWEGSTERLQYCFQLSQDQLIRDAMSATTSFFNCTYGQDGDNPTELTAQDVQLVNQYLLAQNAMKFTRGFEGENKFGTSPIAASYMALGHTDLLSQLYNLSDFIPSHRYSNHTPVFPAEVGYTEYFRWCLSSVGLIEVNASALGADVYDIFMLGREAMGDVELSGYGVQLIYSSPEVVEPRFRTASSLAVKWSQAPTILNDQWVVKLRCTIQNAA